MLEAKTISHQSITKWWILIAMGLVLGLMIIDETIVAVALPTIARNLSLSQLSSHWVINIYVLALSSFVAASGRLGDLIGLKRFFIIGAVLFSIASLICGLAENSSQLIIARLIQGLGAAIMLPISMAMTAIIVPDNYRGFAFGIYGAVGAVFIILGPTIGGFFVEIINWRWIFFINIPSTLLIVFIVYFKWHIIIEQFKKTFDFGGLVSLVFSLVTFITALMQVPVWGWTNYKIILLLIASILGIFSFLFIERRSTDPIMNLSLFNNSHFILANTIILIAQLNKTTVMVFGSLFLQRVLHKSPLTTGLSLTIAMCLTPIAAIIAGKLTDTTGPRLSNIIGIILCAISLLIIAVLIPAKNHHWFIATLIIWGCGLPFLFTPSQAQIMNCAPPDEHGMVGGISLTAQIFGASLCIAILGSFLIVNNNYQLIFFTTAIVNFILLAWRITVPDNKF